jgi:hypothetical protein
MPPPEAQIARGRVAPAEWLDPDAHPRGPVRTVRHWRAFDPIRRMAEHMNGSGKVTVEHVAAADRLRWLWDVAKHGLSGRMPWRYHEKLQEAPTGPTRAALQQARAARQVEKCLKRFTQAQRELIDGIVLRCMTVSQWVRTYRRCSQTTAARQLVAVLDRLVDYFKGEIERYGLPA